MVVLCIGRLVFDTQLHMYRFIVVFFHLPLFLVDTFFIFFHICQRLTNPEAYSHAKTGLSLVFPSWLVHGVAPHHGGRDRVVFAYNLHTVPGTTLSSWAKTTL